MGSLRLERMTDVRLPRAKLEGAIGPLVDRQAPGRDLVIAFVDDRRMRQLNRDFHDCDEPTDVLAFPDSGSRLGDIAVCVDVARREAGARGLTLTSELVLYAVHGTLHLLGHDDHDPDRARDMRQAEVAALAAVGLTTDRLRENA